MCEKLVIFPAEGRAFGLCGSSHAAFAPQLMEAIAMLWIGTKPGWSTLASSDPDPTDTVYAVIRF